MCSCAATSRTASCAGSPGIAAAAACGVTAGLCTAAVVDAVDAPLRRRTSDDDCLLSVGEETTRVAGRLMLALAWAACTTRRPGEMPSIDCWRDGLGGIDCWRVGSGALSLRSSAAAARCAAGDCSGEPGCVAASERSESERALRRIAGTTELAATGAAVTRGGGTGAAATAAGANGGG